MELNSSDLTSKAKFHYQRKYLECEEISISFDVPPRYTIAEQLTLLEGPYLKFKKMHVSNGPFENRELLVKCYVDEKCIIVELDVDRISDSVRPVYTIMSAVYDVNFSSGYSIIRDIPLKQVKICLEGRPHFQTWKGSCAPSKENWPPGIYNIQVVLKIHRQIIDVNNPESLKAEMNTEDFFMSEHLSDVNIICGEKKFPAHRFLLSCKSTVFERMFQSEMKESKEGEIVIEDMEPDEVEHLLEYLYGCLDFTKLANPVPLLKAADKYDLQTLKSKCVPEILGMLTKENAFDMYSLGVIYKSECIANKALEFIKVNKINVAENSEMFMELCKKNPLAMFELHKSMSKSFQS